MVADNASENDAEATAAVRKAKEALEKATQVYNDKGCAEAPGTKGCASYKQAIESAQSAYDASLAAAGKATTEKPAGTEDRQSGDGGEGVSGALVAVIIAVVILLIAVVAAVVLVTRRSQGGGFHANDRMSHANPVYSRPAPDNGIGGPPMAHDYASATAPMSPTYATAPDAGAGHSFIRNNTASQGHAFERKDSTC